MNTKARETRIDICQNFAKAGVFAEYFEFPREEPWLFEEP